MHGSGSHASNPKVLLTPQEPVKPLTPESMGGRGFLFWPTASLPKKSGRRRQRWLVLAEPLAFRSTIRFPTCRVPKNPAVPSPDDPTSDPRPFPGAGFPSGRCTLKGAQPGHPSAAAEAAVPDADRHPKASDNATERCGFSNRPLPEHPPRRADAGKATSSGRGSARRQRMKPPKKFLRHRRPAPAAADTPLQSHRASL